MQRPLAIQQGRIHGRTVADDWAGAVMPKPLAIQKCDGPTDGQSLLSGKKLKSVFDFLTYSRETWFSFSYEKVEDLNRVIGASGTCFFVFACSNKHQYTSLLILHKIIKNRKKLSSPTSA